MIMSSFQVLFISLISFFLLLLLFFFLSRFLLISFGDRLGADPVIQPCRKLVGPNAICMALKKESRQDHWPKVPAKIHPGLGTKKT